MGAPRWPPNPPSLGAPRRSQRRPPTAAPIAPTPVCCRPSIDPRATGSRGWTSGRRSSSPTTRWGPPSWARALEERGFESLWAPEHSHIPLSRQLALSAGRRPAEEVLRRHGPVRDAGGGRRGRRRALKVGDRHLPGVAARSDPDRQVGRQLDQISGGRFLFGIGAGWNAEEMADHGTEFKTRFEVMRERVEAMKAIWTKSKPEYQRASSCSFPPMMTWPKPVQKPHPPVIVGGAFPYGARRAIAYGDGWVPHARRPAYGDVLDLLPDFRKLATEAGRDPATHPDHRVRRRRGPRPHRALPRRRRRPASSSTCPRPRRTRCCRVLDRCATLMRRA